MTLEQIIKLLDAGYTKADIEAMQAQPAADPETQKDPAAAAAEKPEEKPEEKKPESEPVNAQVLQELRDLKKAVYGINIMKSEQPERKSVDDILSEAMKGGIR